METDLQDDLGVYGDDAVDFLVAYGKRVNVDVSKFMAADYFSDEGFDLWSYVIDKLFGITEKRKAFTVGHLYQGIIAGRLDDEIISKIN
jgi:hypothetical protein